MGEYDPPRLAVVLREFCDDTEGCLQLFAEERVLVMCDDGQGWMYGHRPAEDPDDGGYFPSDLVRLEEIEEEDGDDALDQTAGNATSSFDNSSRHPADKAEEPSGWGSAPVCEVEEERAVSSATPPRT